MLSARLLVTQTDATKTRIYIPLLATNAPPTYADATSPTETVTGVSTYGELANSTLWTRDTTTLSKLAPYNAWELETLVSSGAITVGSVALLNRTKGTVVEDTESLFTGSGVSMSSAPFEEGVAGFDSANNEGDEYQVSVRCLLNCGFSGISIYKAGLWVTLDHLAKTETIFRNSLGYRLDQPGPLDTQRSLIDLTLFSLPTAFFQAVAAAPPSGVLPGSLDISLLTAGTNDFGTGGLVPVALSPLNFTSMTKSLLRSPSLSLTSGDRFLPEITQTSGMASVVDTAIVIRAQR